MASSRRHKVVVALLVISLFAPLVVVGVPISGRADTTSGANESPTTGSQAASDQGNEAQSEGGTGAAAGAPTAAEMKALIKQSQNPVGNIAILPFQNNWNYAAGPTKTTVWNMNIQPVVPFMLSPKSNLIERVITPVVNLTPLLPDTDCFALGIETTTPCGAQLGIGNIQLQTYYAPKTNPNGLIWGAGPILSFPTVTQHLGTQQFGGGINAVGLVMPGS